MSDAEPLPDLAPLGSTPPAWEVCPFCGAVVSDRALHKGWHQTLVNRVRGTEDTLAQARAFMQTQKGRIDQLAARVAALDNGSTV